MSPYRRGRNIIIKGPPWVHATKVEIKFVLFRPGWSTRLAFLDVLRVCQYTYITLRHWTVTSTDERLPAAVPPLTYRFSVTYNHRKTGLTTVLPEVTSKPGRRYPSCRMFCAVPRCQEIVVRPSITMITSPVAFHIWAIHLWFKKTL